MDELVKKAKNGDNQAFAEIILKLEDELYKIAMIRLSNNEDVNDAVQETIEKAYKSIRKLKNNMYFKTWIIKILINECNKIYKQHKKQRSYIESEIDKNIESNISVELESNISFYNIIEPLNYDERIAIILYYMNNYTTKEISKMLKVSENTIKSRISRAREKIRKREEEKEYGANR